MYAISFDLDTAALERHYPGKYSRNAYDDIFRELQQYGFYRQQGSVYFGGEKSTPVQCFLATKAICDRYSWFSKVVKDIRMLRIEENNDLMPVVGQIKMSFDALSEAAS